MRYKGLSFCFALLALVLFMGTPTLAAEPQQEQSKVIAPGAAEPHQGKSTAASTSETQQGKVIVAGAGKLTMEDMRGNMQYTHEVAPNVEVMCEGKKCGLSDVKMGDLVKVTLDKQGDKTVVTRIEVKKADSAS
ncbi:MAG: hypothetical protein HY268_22625 [Deltaproteobacteria bacterium]|nr:hypothetical protein [Deltaproteobacteria bacterium]